MEEHIFLERQGTDRNQLQGPDCLLNLAKTREGNGGHVKYIACLLNK